MAVITYLSQLVLHYKVALRLRGDYLRLRRRYKDRRGLKIQFGCGPNLLEGWLNTDLMPTTKGVYAVDVKKGLPFKDHCTRFIYCEHLIEHLTKKDSIAFLKECYRILQPGGGYTNGLARANSHSECLSSF